MKGQSLLEAVLALSVIAIIISGIAVTIVSSLNNSSYGKNQAIATQYAQEAMEIVQQIRSNNYDDFRSRNGIYCLAKDAESLPAAGSCTSPNVDNFIRSVRIEQAPACSGAANVSKVTVEVSWTDGKCSGGSFCHKSSLVSCMSTINPIQAP